MQFDEPVEVTVGDFTFKLPIPKGYTYTRTETPANNHISENFNFYDADRLRMVFIASKENIFSGSSRVTEFQNAKSWFFNMTTKTPDKYNELLLKKFESSNITVEHHAGPILLQYSETSILSLVSFTYHKNNAQSFISILDGIASTVDLDIPIPIYLFNGNPDKDKQFGLTWTMKMISINSQ